MGQKNKETYGFTLVAIGLLMGFFLGAGVVYWYSNRPDKYFITSETLDQLTRLFPATDKETENTHTYTLTPTPPTVSEGISSSDDNESDVPPSDSMSGSQTLTTSQSSLRKAELTEMEQALNDSMFYIDIITDTDVHSGSSDEGSASGSPSHAINIKKEQLIGIKGFYLTSHPPDQGESFETQILDSLLGGVRHTEQERKTFYIEFWESPLNYTRYRMTKNRIVIFGLNQVDFVSLKDIDNNLFLKYYEDFFQIESTLDFKPLVPVNDSLLIHKLEQQWP